MAKQKPRSSVPQARIKDGRRMESQPECSSHQPSTDSLTGPRSPTAASTCSTLCLRAIGRQPAAADRRWVQKEMMALARAIIFLDPFLFIFAVSIRTSRL